VKLKYIVLGVEEERDRNRISALLVEGSSNDT